jgi:hypothetical protein
MGKMANMAIGHVENEGRPLKIEASCKMANMAMAILKWPS